MPRGDRRSDPKSGFSWAYPDHSFALKHAHTKKRGQTPTARERRRLVRESAPLVFSEAFAGYPHDSFTTKPPENGMRKLAIVGSVFPQVTPQTNALRTLKRTVWTRAILQRRRGTMTHSLLSARRASPTCLRRGHRTFSLKRCVTRGRDWTRMGRLMSCASRAGLLDGG